MYEILIVDDDAQMRVALSATIKHLGYNVYVAKDAKEALNYIKKNDYDLIISDLKMPKVNGIEFLQLLKKTKKDVPFIMITAVGTIESAVQAMKLGAFDFILKPFSQETLSKVIKLAISHKNLISKNSKSFNSKIIAESIKMKEVIELALKVAKTDSTVFLTGESGVGKEIIANFIHDNSKRSNESFIAINCSAIPENLLESELFGYEKGAFSGAIKDHKGKFEQAHKGSLFLDEISDMPLNLQTKILRVLQNRVIDKIGSSSSINVDIRIICATNKNIKKEIEEKRFREDLFYRINVFPIYIPSLKERIEDIEPLSFYFLELYANRFDKNIYSISKEALDILKSYNWPGNVRELENVIERACVLCESDIIEPLNIFLHT